MFQDEIFHLIFSFIIFINFSCLRVKLFDKKSIIIILTQTVRTNICNTHNEFQFAYIYGSYQSIFVFIGIRGLYDLMLITFQYRSVRKCFFFKLFDFLFLKNIKNPHETRSNLYLARNLALERDQFLLSSIQLCFIIILLFLYGTLFLFLNTCYF